MAQFWILNILFTPEMVKIYCCTGILADWQTYESTIMQKLDILLQELWAILLILQYVFCKFMQAHNLVCTNYLSALDFCNSPVWNIQFDNLDF